METVQETGRPTHVTCKECGKLKPRSQMERAWRNSGWCNDCRNAYRRRKSAEARPRQRFPRREGDLWRCGDCMESKPIEAFYVRDRGSGPEATAYCKACVKKRDAGRKERERRLAQELRVEVEAWRSFTSRLP